MIKMGSSDVCFDVVVVMDGVVVGHSVVGGTLPIQKEAELIEGYSLYVGKYYYLVCTIG